MVSSTRAACALRCVATGGKRTSSHRRSRAKTCGEYCCIFRFLFLLNRCPLDFTLDFTLQFKKLHRDAIVPQRATDGSAGYDLFPLIAHRVHLAGHGSLILDTGIAINIDNPCIAGVIIPRSGLGIRHGIVLGNLTGLVDGDYQGEIKLSVWNRTGDAFVLVPEVAVAQMVFVPVLHPTWIETTDFSTTTERGEQGFGHSMGLPPLTPHNRV